MKTEDELKLYKDVALISGDIIFRYDILKDNITILGGPVELSKYGNAVNVYGPGSEYANEAYNEVIRYIKEAVSRDEGGLIEEEITVAFTPGNLREYTFKGKIEYDNNWNPCSVLGKIMRHAEVKENTGNYVGSNLTDMEYQQIPEEYKLKMTSVDNTEECHHIDTELVEDALDTLADTGNIGVAVLSLIQKIGKKYRLDCVSISEYDKDTGISSPSFQWHDENNVEVGNVLARNPFDRLAHNDFESNKVMVVDNLATYSGDETILSKLKEIGTKSAVVCTYSGNNVSGFASFEVHRNRVRWSNETVTALRLVSKFIAAYLSNMKNYFELVKKDAKSKTHDEVTGLPKLEIFKKKSLEHINSDKTGKLALACFNFTNFDKVNSIYGRAIGDVILREFTKEYAKIEDRFVLGCRTNADNFLALINHFDTRGNKISSAMVERMKLNFKKICDEKCPDAKVDVNAGIMFLPEHVDNIDNYISKARNACITAKQDGISCVFAY